jgi:hypothetical protein
MLAKFMFENLRKEPHLETQDTWEDTIKITLLGKMYPIVECSQLAHNFFISSFLVGRIMNPQVKYEQEIFGRFEQL